MAARFGTGLGDGASVHVAVADGPGGSGNTGKSGDALARSADGGILHRYMGAVALVRALAQVRGDDTGDFCAAVDGRIEEGEVLDGAAEDTEETRAHRCGAGEVAEGMVTAVKVDQLVIRVGVVERCPVEPCHINVGVQLVIPDCAADEIVMDV